MSVEANKAVVREFVVAYYSRHNPADASAQAAAVVAPDVVDHSAPGGAVGLASYDRAVEEFRAAFPDLHLTVEDVFGEGDRVAVRGTMHGTQANAIFGVAPTGKRVAVTGIMIARVREGKIAEFWLNYDVQGLLEQLGAAPGLAHAD